MSTNAVAAPANWNRYSYVLGDPVNRTDPSGLEPPQLECWWEETKNGFEKRCRTIAPNLGPSPLPDTNQPYPPDPDKQPNRDVEAVVAEYPIGYPGAYNSLAKSDCYKLFGFSSAAAAQKAFTEIKFSYRSLGQLEVEQTAGGGLRIANGTPPPAGNPPGQNAIYVNSDYSSLLFLDRVPAQNITTGQPTIFPYLAAINADMGANMTTAQLANLILLHEFRHTPAGGNAPQERDLATFNKPIYENCIR